jgi:hypothetical protein
MKRWSIAVAMAGVMTLMVGCTTANLGNNAPYVPELPAKDLTSGWTRVGELFRTGPIFSPNGRYVAFWRTDDHVHLVDLDTDSDHIVSDLPDAIRDDGTMLTPHLVCVPSGCAVDDVELETVNGGPVPLGAPADIANDRCWLGWSFAPSGGFDVRCKGDAATNQPVGLYHWNVGDPAATPVAVTTEVDGYWIGLLTGARSEWGSQGVSPNGRYIEIAWDHDFTYGVEVWDTVTHSLLPRQVVDSDALVEAGIGTGIFRTSAPVADDGRVLVTLESWNTVLETMQTQWFDPRTGNREPLAGFPSMTVGNTFRQGYFQYQDYTSLIGHNPDVENALGHQWLPGNILGNFNDPAARWRLPSSTTMMGLASDGSILLASDHPLNPGDPPGESIYVRRGALP